VFTTWVATVCALSVWWWGTSWVTHVVCAVLMALASVLGLGAGLGMLGSVDAVDRAVARD